MSGLEAVSIAPTIPVYANELMFREIAPGSSIISAPISSISDRVSYRSTDTNFQEDQFKEPQIDPYHQSRYSISHNDDESLTQGTLNMLNLDAVKLETALRSVVKRCKIQGNLLGALNELERLIGGCIFIHGSLGSEYLSCAIDLALVYSRLSRFEDRNRILKQIFTICDSNELLLSQDYQEQLLVLLVDYSLTLSITEVDSSLEWLWLHLEARIVLPSIVRILQNKRQFDKAILYLLKAPALLEKSGSEDGNKLFDTILELLLIQVFTQSRQSDIQCLLEKFWPCYTIRSTRLEPACAIILAKALSANYLFDKAEKVFHDPWLGLEKSDKTAVISEEILHQGLREMGFHYERRAKYCDTIESARHDYWQSALQYYSQAHFIAVKHWGSTHAETEITWKLLSEARAQMDIRPNASLAETMERVQSFGNAVNRSTQSKRHTCPYLDCLRSFHRLADLNRHSRKHEERPLYNCDVLGCKYNGERGFYRKDNLLCHQRSVHGIQRNIGSSDDVLEATQATL
ncbi:hypothetical protein MMC17_000922 [Xylographa soralifera]|nr:hypothetical protein [Xylographa soralifera]